MFVTLKPELEGSFVFLERKDGDVSVSVMLKVRAEHRDRWLLESGGELKDETGYAIVYRDGSRKDESTAPKSRLEWKRSPKACFEAHLFLDDAAFDEFMRWLRAGYLPEFLPRFLIGPHDYFKAIPPCHLRFATDSADECDVEWDNIAESELVLDGFVIRYPLVPSRRCDTGPE